MTRYCHALLEIHFLIFSSIAAAIMNDSVNFLLDYSVLILLLLPSFFNFQKFER